jgi:hypothetical protein
LELLPVPLLAKHRPNLFIMDAPIVQGMDTGIAIPMKSAEKEIIADMSVCSAIIPSISAGMHTAMVIVHIDMGGIIITLHMSAMKRTNVMKHNYAMKRKKLVKGMRIWNTANTMRGQISGTCSDAVMASASPHTGGASLNKSEVYDEN